MKNKITIHIAEHIIMKNVQMERRNMPEVMN